MNKKNNIICIIGMHRSGTSLITRLLNLCGLDLGPIDQLMEANEHNAAGYFENLEFVRINDAILGCFGGTWDNLPQFKSGWENDLKLDELKVRAGNHLHLFPAHLPWGWKDPRTSILIPFWKRMIPDLKFVICLRSPLEVAKSLEKRDGIPISVGIHLWDQYTRASIRDTAQSQRIFTFYEDFFKDPLREISRLSEFCCLQIPEDESILQSAISCGLMHHSSETMDLLNVDHVPTEYKIFYIGLRSLMIQHPSQAFATNNANDDFSKLIDKYFKLIEDFHDQEKVAQWQVGIARKEQEISRSKILILGKEQQMGQLQSAIVQKEQQMGQLQAVVTQKEQQMGQLQSAIVQKEQQMGQLQSAIVQKDQQMGQLQSAIVQKDQQVVRLQSTLKSLFNSVSWRLTAPLRWVYLMFVRR